MCVAALGGRGNGRGPGLVDQSTLCISYYGFDPRPAQVNGLGCGHHYGRPYATLELPFRASSDRSRTLPSPEKTQPDKARRSMATDITLDGHTLHWGFRFGPFQDITQPRKGLSPTKLDGPGDGHHPGWPYTILGLRVRTGSGHHSAWKRAQARTRHKMLLRDGGAKRVHTLQ